MKLIIRLSTIFLSTIALAAADNQYDYRTTDAYLNLSDTDKQRLEQVRRDQVLLWGALDMYADEHNGSPPATLDEITPKYLGELPSDPFASPETVATQDADGYTRSKEGLGYLYKRGAPGDRAWIIASVGLPDFPYLADRGNVGLYICKGTWISRVTVAGGRLFEVQPSGASNESHPILQTGSWWNLYFSNDGNPLERSSGSIHAVKIIELDETRPSLVRITFPKNREDHFSIFGAAAKAKEDNEVSFEDAVAEWESAISEWETMWVNLGYVVSMTKVEADGALMIGSARRPDMKPSEHRPEKFGSAKEARTDLMKLKRESPAEPKSDNN